MNQLFYILIAILTKRASKFYCDDETDNAKVPQKLLQLQIPHPDEGIILCVRMYMCMHVAMLFIISTMHCRQ